jgi:hypothetical protein
MTIRGEDFESRVLKHSERRGLHRNDEEVGKNTSAALTNPKQLSTMVHGPSSMVGL